MRAAALRTPLFAILAWAACASLSGCDDQPSTLTTCSIDSLAGADATSASFVDCGAFSRDSDLYTDAAMVSAQACVLNAINRGQGFVLLYDANDGSDPVSGGGQASAGLRAAYTGVKRGGKLVLTTYAGQGDPATPNQMDFVTSRTCESIGATPDCKPRVGVPCLACTGMDTGAIICRGG